jgi:hypothetical protein
MNFFHVTFFIFYIIPTMPLSFFWFIFLHQSFLFLLSFFVLGGKMEKKLFFFLLSKYPWKEFHFKSIHRKETFSSYREENFSLEINKLFALPKKNLHSFGRVLRLRRFAEELIQKKSAGFPVGSFNLWAVICCFYRAPPLEFYCFLWHKLPQCCKIDSKFLISHQPSIIKLMMKPFHFQSEVFFRKSVWCSGTREICSTFFYTFLESLHVFQVKYPSIIKRYFVREIKRKRVGSRGAAEGPSTTKLLQKKTFWFFSRTNACFPRNFS